MEKIKYSWITAFLEQKDVLVIGVSRNDKDYSRNLFRELLKLNYNAIPINPNVSEIEGNICYPSAADVPSNPTAAIILTPSVTLVNIVHDCIAKGIKHIWIYNGNEKDEHLRSSIEICHEQNVNLVYGFCPFMFLPGAGFPHKFHGKVAKLFGKYPVKA